MSSSHTLNQSVMEIVELMATAIWDHHNQQQPNDEEYYGESTPFNDVEAIFNVENSISWVSFLSFSIDLTALSQKDAFIAFVHNIVRIKFLHFRCIKEGRTASTYFMSQQVDLDDALPHSQLYSYLFKFNRYATAKCILSPELQEKFLNLEVALEELVSEQLKSSVHSTTDEFHELQLPPCSLQQDPLSEEEQEFDQLECSDDNTSSPEQDYSNVSFSISSSSSLNETDFSSTSLSVRPVSSSPTTSLSTGMNVTMKRSSSGCNLCFKAPALKTAPVTIRPEKLVSDSLTSFNSVIWI